MIESIFHEKEKRAKFTISKPIQYYMLWQEYKDWLHEMMQQPVIQLKNLSHLQAVDELTTTFIFTQQMWIRKRITPL
jgi:hypothetical protein